MRMIAKISAEHEPLMEEVLQIVTGGDVLNVAADLDGLSYFGS